MGVSGYTPPGALACQRVGSDDLWLDEYSARLQVCHGASQAELMKWTERYNSLRNRSGSPFYSSARIFSTTCLSTGYGWAPTTRYWSAKTSAGTPLSPYSRARSISADTCASRSGFASTLSKFSVFRPTCSAISLRTALSSIERACCQYACIAALWKAFPLPCDSAYFSA